VTVFRRTAEVLASPQERRLSEDLAEHLRMTAGIGTSPAERRSWDRSLPILAFDLVQAGLSQVEMLIEYQLPLTSKRVDVVLAGQDRRTGGDAYVVVELKQWSHAELFEDDPQLVLVAPGAQRSKRAGSVSTLVAVSRRSRGPLAGNSLFRITLYVSPRKGRASPGQHAGPVQGAEGAALDRDPATSAVSTATAAGPVARSRRRQEDR
jgi:hypothetical protein